MVRGIVVVFTALFSIIFLKRRYARHHWTSLFFIVAGVGWVGYVSSVYTSNHATSESSTANHIMGVTFLVIAEIF